MLNRTKKRELLERLEAIEPNGGPEGALAAIVRELLEATPTESEQTEAVRSLIDSKLLGAQ